MAPVVQKMDNAIHWVSLYPTKNAIGLANTYTLDDNLWGDQRYSAFEQPAFCFYCCYTMSLLLHYRLAQVLTSTFETVVNRPLSSWL